MRKFLKAQLFLFKTLVTSKLFKKVPNELESKTPVGDDYTVINDPTSTSKIMRGCDIHRPRGGVINGNG